MLLDGKEECEIQQVLSHRDRSRDKQKKHQLEYFVLWKGMGPEHSKWLRDSDLLMPLNLCRITWPLLSRRTGQVPVWAGQLHQLQVSLK